MRRPSYPLATPAHLLAHREAGTSANPRSVATLVRWPGSRGSWWLTTTSRSETWCAAYLDQAGYLVTVAGDGASALQAVQTDPPDLVVLDLMLPSVGGLEICRRLRASTAVPIVILTAFGTEDDRVLGLELGADDYVTKRFSPRELVLRVGSVLRPAAGWVLRLHVRWWRRTGARSRYQPRAGLPLRADPAPGRDRCATPARLTGV